jgi:hypothetical protein
MITSTPHSLLVRPCQRAGSGTKGQYPQRSTLKPPSRDLVERGEIRILVIRMTFANESNLPQICRESGLSCEACTSHSARDLARVCRGLGPKAVRQLFVQLYPHPACSPMHANFVAAYRQGSAIKPGPNVVTLPQRAMPAVA